MRIPFFRKTGWNKFLLAALFVIKVLAGLVYGWLYTRVPDYKISADTWRIFYSSVTERDWLLNDPLAFFADLFRPRYAGDSELLATSNSFFNDVKEVLVVKLGAIFNVFSRNNYWVNVIFFEFLSFFGPVALARVWNKYNSAARWPVIIGCFLWPSVLLWTSGFHKDGLILSSIGIVILNAINFIPSLVPGQLSQTGPAQRPRRYPTRWPSRLWIFLHLFLIFLFRNYMAGLLVLALLPWLLSEHRPQFRWQLFLSTYLFAGLFFFLAPKLHPGLDFPRLLAKRQQEFFALKGESLLITDSLQPNAGSFLRNTGAAVNHAIFRPYPWEIKKLSYIPAAFEILAFITLLLLGFRLWLKQKRRLSPFALFNIFFAVSMLLVMGYTIPFLGAIVRYRSLAWPFMITPLLIFVWKKKI